MILIEATVREKFPKVLLLKNCLMTGSVPFAEHQRKCSDRLKTHKSDPIEEDHNESLRNKTGYLLGGCR